MHGGKAVDRYIAGADVPVEQVQQAWRNMVGTVNAPSPVYDAFYRAVREANLSRQGKHQMRIVLGDPSADWEKINNREQLDPLLRDRESWYARAAKEEVLAKKRARTTDHGRCLHFLRLMGPGYIEQQLRDAGASTYLIVFGTQVYGDPEKRFEAWPVPAIMELRGNWVGDLLAMGANWPGRPKLAADALLYVARRRDDLTSAFHAAFRTGKYGLRKRDGSANSHAGRPPLKTSRHCGRLPPLTQAPHDLVKAVAASFPPWN
jgi:hypothetical protein